MTTKARDVVVVESSRPSQAAAVATFLRFLRTMSTDDLRIYRGSIERAIKRATDGAQRRTYGAMRAAVDDMLFARERSGR